MLGLAAGDDPLVAPLADPLVSVEPVVLPVAPVAPVAPELPVAPGMP
ncbi:MAG: hypothetical protein FJ027_02905, partial [Candidatus Rokubacteria bacterium]|nr:hypothetical protein [Candidatus Rokubacteria bacterium]